MRSINLHLIKLSAIVVALLAMTLLVVKPASTASASAAGPMFAITECFPSCQEDDSRMMSLSGAGNASFSGGTIQVGFTTPVAVPSILISVFDADSRGPDAMVPGLWDRGTINLEFKVYADPSGTGNPTTLFDSFSGSSVDAVNDGWWDHTYDPGNEPNFADALDPSGSYSFVLEISTNDAATLLTLNGFKLRTDGDIRLKGQSVQFMAKAGFQTERNEIYNPDLGPGVCPSDVNATTTYDGTWEFEFEVPEGTVKLELWDGDMDHGTALSGDGDDPDTPATGVCEATGGTAAQCAGNSGIPVWALGTQAVAEGAKGAGAPADDNANCLVVRSPNVIYRLLPPSELLKPLNQQVGFENLNPSGTGEWEKFLISSDPNDDTPEEADHNPPSIEKGTWKIRIEGLDVLNQFTMHFTFTLAPPDTTCPICTEPEIVVNTPIKLDAKDLAGTAGILAPFASFDGTTITIDLGDRPLHITSDGSISVLAGANAQPPQFHKSGNHGTPNLTIKSTCTLLIDESDRGTVNALFRSLTGVIETNALGGKAGDILLEFDGAIEINGGVQSFQEKLPDSASSLSGAITIKSVCGEIRVGPKGWVVTWGENPGTSPISLIQLGTENIVVNGLVMNRTNHTIGSNPPPIINVHAVGGFVRIDGSNLVLDEFSLMGTKYDLTSGLLTISRVSSDVGKINIQASADVVVVRNVLVGLLNRTSFAAVATVVNSNSPIGGTIRVRALNGGIIAQGRAFQADGRGNNSAALIELIASGNIWMQSPLVLNSEHTPTVTTSAATVNGVGKAGKNVLQSCTAVGVVLVDTNASVLATGVSNTGINQFIAAGGVNVLGTALPAFVGGVPVCPPTPLF